MLKFAEIKTRFLNWLTSFPVGQGMAAASLTIISGTIIIYSSTHHHLDRLPYILLGCAAAMIASFVAGLHLRQGRAWVILVCWLVVLATNYATIATALSHINFGVQVVGAKGRDDLVRAENAINEQRYQSDMAAYNAALAAQKAAADSEARIARETRLSGSRYFAGVRADQITPPARPVRKPETTGEVEVRTITDKIVERSVEFEASVGLYSLLAVSLVLGLARAVDGFQGGENSSNGTQRAMRPPAPAPLNVDASRPPKIRVSVPPANPRITPPANPRIIPPDQAENGVKITPGSYPPVPGGEIGELADSDDAVPVGVPPANPRITPPDEPENWTPPEIARVLWERDRDGGYDVYYSPPGARVRAERQRLGRAGVRLQRQWGNTGNKSAAARQWVIEKGTERGIIL